MKYQWTTQDDGERLEIWLIPPGHHRASDDKPDRTATSQDGAKPGRTQLSRRSAKTGILPFGIATGAKPSSTTSITLD
jgi:hypothetical protein